MEDIEKLEAEIKRLTQENTQLVAELELTKSDLNFNKWIASIAYREHMKLAKEKLVNELKSGDGLAQALFGGAKDGGNGK